MGSDWHLHQRLQGIGKTSGLFRTTDIRRSDKQAPTGLLGPFRGRFRPAGQERLFVLSAAGWTDFAN
jgi:hypothetical protein